MNLREDDIREIVEGFAKDYCLFMKIDKLPEYTLVRTSGKNDESDYGIIACTSYIPEQDSHFLYVENRMVNDEVILKNCERFFFHEFTHMVDAEQYAKRSKEKYFYLRGYTEYHASQVELMYMLDAKSINEKISFTMDKRILPQMSCNEFISDKYNVLESEITSGSLYGDKNKILDMIGLLYNYLGLKSICEIYSEYKEYRDYSVMTNIFGSLLWSQILHGMIGWFNDDQVSECFNIYSNALKELLNQYDDINRSRFRTREDCIRI